METLERPPAPVPMTDDVPFNPGSSPRRSAFQRLWRRVCAFTSIAAVALLASGLAAIGDQLAADWHAAASKFKWVVLVTGDQVEIDEVGRYLKDIEGVGPVTLVQPAAIVEQLQTEALLKGQVSALDPAALPTVWQVSWTSSLEASRLPAELDELRRLPAVVDVAFDQRELDKISVFRQTWLRLRVLMSALGLLGAFVFALLIGRFLFFTNLSTIRPAALAAFVAGSVTAWMAGLLLCAWLVGPFSWHLAWGGLVAAVARLAWGRVRDSE